MTIVERKSEIEPVDGTPEKRMFWSIISDYGLRTGICELVDNALDLWRHSGRKRGLQIDIQLDTDSQLITINDNAGGIEKKDLRLLVAPGGSTNSPDAEVIGIFGVGSKRAGIALGEQIEIRTRYGSQQSHQIDITRDWLESEDWNLAAYEIPNIAKNTTSVEISKLRKPISDEDVQKMKHHLSETYCWFLLDGCQISVNGENLEASSFDNWSFPKAYPPNCSRFDVEIAGKGKVKAAITSGLINDRIPDAENYGVYFYCNHRLILKELRSREVGYFISTEAGVPHPDASLCRTIVDLQGPAELMPWNSSKSDINLTHPVFEAIRPRVIELTGYFSSLSRRLKSDWQGQVFDHASGNIKELKDEDISSRAKLKLPKLPRSRKNHVEHLKFNNANKIASEPWTLGLLEAMGAVEIVTRQRLDTKNRIALILLDSNFEIALKEFIVHRHDLFPQNDYGDAVILRLFRRRSNVIDEITSRITIPPKHLRIALHYYNMRNKLIHERATTSVTDSDIAIYKSTIERVLNILFKLKFK